MNKCKMEFDGCKCLRCGHRWVPRRKEPRQCPNCKSAYWDVEKIK